MTATMAPNSTGLPPTSPPSYTEATESSSTPAGTSAGASASASTPPAGDSKASHRTSGSHAAVDTSSLPAGWIAQYSAQYDIPYYVDTRADGGKGKSSWIHPYDDEGYLASLSAEERERVKALRKKELQSRGHNTDSGSASASGSNKAKDAFGGPSTASSSATPNVNAAPSSKPPTGLKKLGRNLKDKVTHTTHEERVAHKAEQERLDAERQKKLAAARASRAEQQRQQYEVQLALDRAASAAAQTGQPQFLGHDQQGRQILVLPPGPPYRGAEQGYDPFGGFHPNTRFLRPSGGYGYGGGGGFGPMGAASGVGLGLLGGVLLGGLLF